jgi:hypothetical protein
MTFAGSRQACVVSHDRCQHLIELASTIEALQSCKTTCEDHTETLMFGSLKQCLLNLRSRSKPTPQRQVGTQAKMLQKEAATLGRTTDLRIIAVTAIPRSTTELQQLVENESQNIVI